MDFTKYIKENFPLTAIDFESGIPITLNDISYLVGKYIIKLNESKCNSPKTFLPYNVNNDGVCTLPTHCDYKIKSKK